MLSLDPPQRVRERQRVRESETTIERHTQRVRERQRRVRGLLSERDHVLLYLIAFFLSDAPLSAGGLLRILQRCNPENKAVV